MISCFIQNVVTKLGAQNVPINADIVQMGWHVTSLTEFVTLDVKLDIYKHCSAIRVSMVWND